MDINTILTVLLVIGIILILLMVAFLKTGKPAVDPNPQDTQDYVDLVNVSMRVVDIGKRMGESDEEIHKALDGVERGWRANREQRTHGK